MKHIRLRFPLFPPSETRRCGLLGLRSAIYYVSRRSRWAAAGLVAQTAPVAADSAPARLLSFCVRCQRIEPSSTSVPAGRYMIRLENGVTVNTAIPFTLDVKGGARMAAAQVATNPMRAQGVELLAPCGRRMPQQAVRADKGRAGEMNGRALQPPAET
jgi:hypothetical protein